MMDAMSTSHDIMRPIGVMDETQRSGGLKRSRDDHMGPGGKERRTRTIFNLAQINALERIFLDVEYPDGDLKAKLAERLEVDENTVQIWFQNRRAKKKRLQRGQPPSQNKESFHQQQVVSHPGHLLPISDRQNGFPLTTGGAFHYTTSVPRENQCYSSSHVMGHPEHPDVAKIHWAGDSHQASTDHYVVEQNGVPALQRHNSPIIPNQENRSAMESGTIPSNLPETPSPARSIQSPAVSEGGIIDQIKKWPVKEPPTSQSSFGKVDFPKLPRVCIRHDSSQLRTVPDTMFGSPSPVSKNDRDIAKMRMKVLKKDPPKSPPPNQTCAAIPRSQRNELELALVKHGLVEDASSENGLPALNNAHRSGYVSEEWSSSSEESSDSEGLAPPRRRRKFVRDVKKPPPNTSCASVPLHDRTLPCLHNIPKFSSEKVPKNQTPLPKTPNSQPKPVFEFPVGSENLSDWDTDSDDSSWAYFDQPPTMATSSKIDSSQSLPDLPDGQCGPQSAPPVLGDGLGTNEMICVRNGDTADCEDDEFSEITLAREFAEMLPSPFGTYLPIYHEEPSSNLVTQPHKRSRILSDSALLTPRVDIRPHSSVDLPNRNSPVRSSDSSLSNLSSLFSIPVSPSELVKHLAEGIPEIDEDAAFESPTTSRIPYQSDKQPDRAEPEVRQGFPQNCQTTFQEGANRSAYAHQQISVGDFVNAPLSCRESNGFSLPETNQQNSKHMLQPSDKCNGSLQGIIRPIPTRPGQTNTSTPSQQSHAHISTPVSNAMIDYQPMHQSAVFGQHPMQRDGNACFQEPNTVHPQANLPPNTMVHHQPSFSPQHHTRWTNNTYNAAPQTFHSSGPPRNVSLPHQSVPGVAPPSDDKLPPNQVCTVVPDAVSSQGLMARYLAWTQGRTLER